MTTRVATASERAESAQPVEANEAQSGVSSRRLKKREIDRRCQRQARERTKSRIAYLEGLVEDFRKQDSSGQVATLMKQLKEMESERDIMAKTLKDIQKAMDVHKPICPKVEEAEDKIDKCAERIADDSGRTERHSSSASSVDDMPLLYPPETIERPERASPARNFDLATFSPSPSLPLDFQDQLFAPEVVPLQVDDPQSSSHIMVQAKNVKDLDLMPSNYTDNWAIARHSCPCRSCHDNRPGRRSVWRGNYWQYANEVLTERFTWTDEVLPETDPMSDDVPVRALLEGWDAVARRGPLHPSWQILRRIDETLFSMCPNTERLAILRAMHALLQFHTESTAERYARLPPWYMRRPSQKIAHSYAIDFFAWPGVRERFIFNEHDYCGNEFWTLFTASLKILWPYEFRDCYSREINTGLYKVSPMFDQRLMDIRCWTMGPDIFRRFPELYSDMPALNNVPRLISSTASRVLTQMQQRNLLPLAVSPKTVSPRSAVTIDEDTEARPRTTHRQHIPAKRVHSHVAPPSKVQQPHHHQFSQANHQASRQANSNPQAFGVPTFNAGMALDDFAYGSLSEADFAAVYHGDNVEGFSDMIF